MRVQKTLREKFLGLSTSRFTRILLLAAALAPTFPALAKGPVNVRPLTDLLDAQGMTSQFVPPVGDYVGWTDGDVVTFALVDYAGVANAFLEEESGGAVSLDTRTNGFLHERQKEDGRAAVTVRLVTQNALAWAFNVADADFENDPLPFLNTPLSFGARAQDVLDGAEPSLGLTIFKAKFMNSGLDAPLPDLVQLFLTPEREQLPFEVNFRTLAPGTRPDGTAAFLFLHQDCTGVYDEAADQAVVTCDIETIEIR